MCGMCWTLVLVAERKPELRPGKTISWCVSGSLGFTRLVLRFHMVYLAKQKPFFLSAVPFSWRSQPRSHLLVWECLPRLWILLRHGRNEQRTIAVTWWLRGRKEPRFNKPKRIPLRCGQGGDKREGEGGRRRSRRRQSRGRCWGRGGGAAVRPCVLYFP